MIFSSSDLPHQEESNGNNFIEIGPIMTEIFNFKCQFGILYMWNSRNVKYFDFKLINTGSSDPILIILGSLESSHQDESNGIYIIAIGWILAEIF